METKREIFENAYQMLESQLRSVRYYLHVAQRDNVISNPVAVEELINNVLELLVGWPEELNQDQDTGAVDVDGETSQFEERS